MDGKQFLEDEFLKEFATICAPLLVLEIAAWDFARPRAMGGTNGQKGEKGTSWWWDS